MTDLLSSGEKSAFDAVFDEVEKSGGFNLTRIERDKAIHNCIEYTKTLFAPNSL